MAEEVDDVLGCGRLFGDAPFVELGNWSYVPNYQPFNVASKWRHDLLKRLAGKEAHEQADRTEARRILLDLRNALAHGGIAYLDEHGRHEGEAMMLAFASARMQRGRPVSLNIIRVSQDDFFDFLMAWADWLATPQLHKALDRANPLAA